MANGFEESRKHGLNHGCTVELTREMVFADQPESELLPPDVVLTMSASIFYSQSLEMTDGGKRYETGPVKELLSLGDEGFRLTSELGIFRIKKVLEL